MPQNNNPIRAFFAELLQRRVLQIGGAYVAGAWLCVEIFTFLFDQFLAPGWAHRLMAIVLVVGFPISMVLAWIIQIDEDGHWEIDHSRGDTKNLAVAIVVGVLITAGLSWWFLPQREPPPVFEPMPMSLAVHVSGSHGISSDLEASADRLYLSALTGLERSSVPILVQAAPHTHTGDAVSIGRDLEVAWLALLSLESPPDTNRVQVELFEVVSGETTWEQTFELGTANTSEIAHGIANDLLEYMGWPPLDMNQFYGTNSHEAYEAYLDGRILARQSDHKNAAAERFQAAIDLDPGFAVAYVGLAQSLY